MNTEYQLLLFLLLFFKEVWAFVGRGIDRQKFKPLMMVRNIDHPECLIFYGDGVLNEEDGGLMSLIEECKETGAALISISTNKETKLKAFPEITFLSPTREAPNPLDLWEAIQSVVIQPRPFGGSAGFGTKLPDPERQPMPARTVVFCETVDQTRAARFCGMRVMCFNDNDLADAIVDTFDFYLDDIATPGSYWLNPPHPRDDEGNKVYVGDVVLEFETFGDDDRSKPNAENESIDDMDDDELNRILADMAPLR